MADPNLGYQIAQQTTPTSTFNYRYPLSKLDSSDDYLKIDIVKYIPPGFGNFGAETLALPSGNDVITSAIAGDKTKIMGTIILPIPDDVKDNNTVSWGESSLNPIQAATGSALAAAVTSKSVNEAGTRFKSIADKVFKSATSGATQQYLSALGIQVGMNLLGQDATGAKLTSRYAGLVANTNIELVFSGVTLREGFSFGFDLTPRSQKEAECIKQIIRKFKMHSAGKKGRTGENAAGLFLQAPEVFRIQYMSGSKPHPYLNKFKICALKGMSVSYAPSGTYATYSDGAPVNIQLALGFQELSPIYAEDYESGIGAEGVGY